MMTLNKEQISSLAKTILDAHSFVLTTHKNCDADGLGSILAFHHLIKNQNKSVKSLVVDAVAKRYDFMNHQRWVEVYQPSKTVVPSVDLALVFDTNDDQLIEPLYSELKKKAKKIIFIDHHQPKEKSNSDQFFISEDSASTGELCYMLIEEMKLPITKEIALAIYISIIFDTHMFRSAKNLSQTFYTCFKIFHHIGVNNIYEQLFCQYDHNSWDQMLKTLNAVQYDSKHQMALIELNYKEFQQSGLSAFQFLDFLELVMKKKSIQVGVLSVEKKPSQFKVSFRSKGQLDVAQIASHIGGGGHAHSSGATLTQWPKEKILNMIQKELNKTS